MCEKHRLNTLFLYVWGMLNIFVVKTFHLTKFYCFPYVHQLGQNTISNQLTDQNENTHIHTMAINSHTRTYAYPEYVTRDGTNNDEKIEKK